MELCLQICKRRFELPRILDSPSLNRGVHILQDQFIMLTALLYSPRVIAGILEWKIPEPYILKPKILRTPKP